MKTIKLDWEEGSIRQAVLICDAPDHGETNNDIPIPYDRYPKGIQGQPKLEKLVHELYEMNVNLSTLRLNFECDKMFTVMHDHYGEEKDCPHCRPDPEWTKKENNAPYSKPQLKKLDNCFGFLHPNLPLKTVMLKDSKMVPVPAKASRNSAVRQSGTQRSKSTGRSRASAAASNKNQK